MDTGEKKCHSKGLEQGLFFLWHPIGGAGAGGVMVIVVGNGHGDTSSNPGRDWLHFT